MTVRRRLLEGHQREVIEKRMAKKVWATRRVRDDAFELYWRMGEGRSYRKVAEAINRSIGVVSMWARKYEWARRVEEREEEIDRRVSEKIVSSEVAARLRYGSIIDRLIDNFLNDIKRLDEAGMKASIINTIGDLERAVRIGLLLHGDRLERADQGNTVMEKTTVERLVANPRTREALETLWREMPGAIQGQVVDVAMDEVREGMEFGGAG